MKNLAAGYERNVAEALFEAISGRHFIKRVGLRQTGKDLYSIDVQIHDFASIYEGFAFISGFLYGYYAPKPTNLTFFDR